MIQLREQAARYRQRCKNEYDREQRAPTCASLAVGPELARHGAHDPQQDQQHEQRHGKRERPRLPPAAFSGQVLPSQTAKAAGHHIGVDVLLHERPHARQPLEVAAGGDEHARNASAQTEGPYRAAQVRRGPRFRRWTRRSARATGPRRCRHRRREARSTAS